MKIFGHPLVKVVPFFVVGICVAYFYIDFFSEIIFYLFGLSVLLVTITILFKKLKHPITISILFLLIGMLSMGVRGSNELDYRFKQKATQSSIIKEYCTTVFTEKLGEQAGFMQALLLGDKNKIPKEQLDSFAAVGIIHILAVSGLHVGIIYLLLSWLLKRVFAYKHTLRVVVIILFIWGFALLTGFSPSVTRAALMFSFIAIGNTIYRQQSIYAAIATSAFLILLFDPLALFQLSFQLSYMAVLGIVFLYPIIMKRVETKSKILNFFISIMVVSFSAQLAVAPITINTFHAFPTYFLIANLLVLPLVTALLPLGFLLLLFAQVPILSVVISFIIKGLVNLLWFFTGIISNLPFSPINQLFPSSAVAWLLLAGLVTLIVAKSAKYLKLALSIFILSFTVYLFNEVSILNRNKLVVLANKKYMPVLLVSGKTAIEIYDVKGTNPFSGIGDDLDKLASNWKIVERYSYPKNVSNNVYQWGDKTFVVIDKALVLKTVSKPLKVNCLLVKDCMYGIDEVLTNFAPQKVILGNKVLNKDEWLNAFDEVHVMAEDENFEATI